jgi:hypothetical protein
MKTCESRTAGHVAVIELLAFVARAAGIGIAAGVVLGGATLILSAESAPFFADAAEIYAASLPHF